MTNAMNNGLVDLYPYPIPENFHTGTTFSGHFITAYISNEDRLKLPPDNPNHDKAPKYAFSCAIPTENPKTKCREVLSVKFSCMEEDYLFLKSNEQQLRFQPVSLVCEPDAWANSSTRFGLYYKYVSNTLQRFDGKPLTEKKA